MCEHTVAARLSDAGLLILDCFSSRGEGWYETVSFTPGQHLQNPVLHPRHELELKLGLYNMADR